MTTLLPYGPEIPRAGLIKTVTEEEVEIVWEPPKGGFTKYLLCVDPNVNTCKPALTISPTEVARTAEFYSNINNHIGSYVSFDKIVQDYTERELSNLLTNYRISGLKPGNVPNNFSS